MSTVAMTTPATARAGRTPTVVEVLVATTFAVLLNETIMVNAIPRLMAAFKVTPRAAQWLSTAYRVIPVSGLRKFAWPTGTIGTRSGQLRWGRLDGHRWNTGPAFESGQSWPLSAMRSPSVFLPGPTHRLTPLRATATGLLAPS